MSGGRAGQKIGGVWGVPMGEAHARLQECIDAAPKGRKKVIALASRCHARSPRVWQLVDLRACVFGWMNCSRGEGYGNVRVTESGHVELTRNVRANEELMWWYGDQFVL